MLRRSADLLFNEIDGDDQEGRIEEVMISRMRGWSWGGVEEICNVSRSICSGSSRRDSSSAKRVMSGWPFLRRSPSLACISRPAWALTGSPGFARPAPRRWTAQPACLQSMEAR